MRMTTFALALLAAALTLGVSREGAGAESVPAPLRPPDLDQKTPGTLSVKPLRRRGGIRWRLGFRSAAVNVGQGPLFIRGRRGGLRTPVLTAEQIVARADGSTQTYPSVGTLRYERFSDHQHWHLTGFARYELRRASGRLARPSLKRGFCLADSFRIRGMADPPQPVVDIGYGDTDCGKRKPRTRYVEEGISVAWGDDYDPHLEGQQIDISRLRAGLYDLVNRVNPDRRLREASYRNNDASLRLRLSWPRGLGSKPGVVVLKRCPTSARCPLRGHATVVRAAKTLDETALVSRQSDASGGAAADRPSMGPSISAGGRFVAFLSSGRNLSSAEDRDRVRNVFVRDLRRSTTTLVSRASGHRGAAANGDSYRPRISGNGRFVAFESSATNLSGAELDRTRDIFVRDLRSGATTLVSRADGRAGRASRGNATGPSISADGRFVAFESPAANLTPDDNDSATNKYDVFVRDLRRGRTELVSRAGGAHGRAGSASAQAMISANGRYVAFDSGAGNLTPEGNHADLQVFVRDLRRKRTVLVSRAGGRHGALARGTASQPSISGRGRYVLFESPSPNLSRGDRKGFDLFVRDLRLKTTRLVTRASGARGAGANAAADCYSISANGRYAVFESVATNLSGEDEKGVTDVFMRDLRRSTTTLVSRASGLPGVAGNRDSGCPSVSADGRAIAFESFATNLSPLDRPSAEDVFVRR